MGKAKDGSECYTRQNKTGGSYITCEGSQKSRKLSAGKTSKSRIGGRPAGKKVDTNAPRNVGKVVTQKPKFEDDKAKQTDGKPKAKGEVSIVTKGTKRYPSRKITWIVPKHSVSQSESFKVIDRAERDYTRKINDLNEIPTKKTVPQQFTNQKPYVIDARIENNKLKYRELDIPPRTSKDKPR